MNARPSIDQVLGSPNSHRPSIDDVLGAPQRNTAADNFFGSELNTAIINPANSANELGSAVSRVSNPLTSSLPLALAMKHWLEGKLGKAGQYLEHVPTFHTEPGVASFGGTLTGYLSPFRLASEVEKGIKAIPEAVSGVEKGIEMLPKAASKAEALLKGLFSRGASTAAASALGAPEGERRNAALYGAGAELLMPAGATGLNALRNFFSKPVVRQAPEVLTGEFTNQLAHPQTSAPEVLSGAFHDAADKSRTYGQLEDQVNALDANKTPLDISPYKQAAQGMLDNIMNKIKSNRSSYSDVTKLLNKIVDEPPRNYQDVLEQYQMLNSKPTWNAFTQKEVMGMKNHVRQLKSALMDTLDKQAQTNPEVGDFLSNWRARNADVAAHKGFYDFPRVAKVNTVVNEAASGDSQAFKKLFFTKSGSQSRVPTWEKFKNLTGTSDDEARNLLKNHYFDEARLNSREFDNHKALGLYEKLSPQEKDWMFTPHERQLMDTAQDALNVSKKLKRSSVKSIVGSLVARSLIGGALGGYYGWNEGNPLLYALGGALLPSGIGGARRILGEHFASNPKNVVKAINRLAKYPVKSSSTDIKILPMVSAALGGGNS